MLDERGRIQSNDEIAEDFYLARVEAPRIAAIAAPGQFVNLQVSQTGSPFLRVPLSLCGTNAAAGTIDLLYEDMGPKTRALSQLPVASSVACLGPLGNGFNLSDVERQAILVGGGIGIPPLLFLGDELKKAGHSNVHLVVGARYAAKHLPDAMLTTTTKISKATDDGSLGHHGLVTELVQQALAADGEKSVYTCGPHAMMKAVAALCSEYEVACQASLEEYMACGYGVCVGCVVPLAPEVQSESPYGHYSRICVDGPVFDAQRVCWEG